MDDQAARAAASALWRAWQSDRRIDGLAESCRPGSLDEGYRIQAALAETVGQMLRGWKIAATSAHGQAHLGISEPLAGRLFDGFSYRSGAELPAEGLHMGVAEAEFAFVLADDLEPRAEPFAVADVLARVAALHTAIEVPDSRYTDFTVVGAPQLVADNACGRYFVLGNAAQDWRDVDLARHPVSMSVNGAVAGEGSGANVLGDPRIALAWLANDRARRGTPLSAGDVVTTGTCLVPVPIKAGDRVLADFGALGTTSVSFRAP